MIAEEPMWEDESKIKKAIKHEKNMFRKKELEDMLRRLQISKKRGKKRHE